jgi:hypothetical protein
LSDKKIESLAYRLKDYESLRALFAELNFEFADKPVNKEHWNQDQIDLVQEAKIIATKDDYRIYYIQTNTDSLIQWKGIATKIIKENNGLCLICSHNPSGFKWVFSSLSKDFSQSFTETRHVPIDIRPDIGVPQTFVEFLEKIKINNNSTTSSIASQISEAFDSFAVVIHNELTINVFEALKSLSEGIILDESNGLALDENTLEEIREPIFILLYRIIFILYAEDRGIFPVEHKIYHEKFSFKWLKQEWLLKSENQKKLSEYQVHERLWNFFRLIELGSEDLGYDSNEFFMRSYYGRIFDRNINKKLDKWKIKNQYLLDAISLLTRTRDKNSNYFFLDYSALETRHLGSIYEHLLEYHLTVQGKKIADLPNPQERKSSGSYYTPQYIVDYIVQNTIEPLIDKIRKDTNDKFEQIEKILSLNILDPAMGSGHFLIGVVNYIAEKICEIEDEEITEQHLIERKRDVVRRCIYGVDMNPLAVDLAMVALWLETLSSEKPLSFLSAHLKCGNSLLGSQIDILFNKQSTLMESQKGREQFKRTIKEFLMFENLDDDSTSAVRTKIERYQNIQSKGTIYYNIKSLLDCKVAESFGVKIPVIADFKAKIGENSLDFFTDESWRKIQQLSINQRFFHWDLEFPDIFYDSEGNKKDTRGFDVVLGNPPYITTRKIPKEEREVYWKKYEDFLKDEMNTFTLFYAKIDELIRKKGLWGFITPSGWYTNNPYDKLRKWFFTNNSIRKIVDFPYRFFPFDEVNTETAIVIGAKSIEEGNIIEILRGDKETLKKTNKITNELLENRIPQKTILDVSKHRFYIYQTEISMKLNKIKQKFGDIIEVHNPSSLDRRTRYPKTKKQYDKCVFSKEEIKNDSKLKEMCKPCLVGEDIQRFYCLETNRFTNIEWKENGNQKQLSSKTLKWMNQLKIVGQRITGQVSRRMIFSIDFENRITMPSVNIVLLKDYDLKNIGEHTKLLYYLQAVLNSKLINYFYETQFGEANTNITSDVIEGMPLILEIDSIWEKSKKLSELYVKNTKNEQIEKINKLESEIDHEIYRIFGLTKSEINIVESYYKK